MGPTSKEKGGRRRGGKGKGKGRRGKEKEGDWSRGNRVGKGRVKRLEGAEGKGKGQGKEGKGGRGIEALPKTNIYHYSTVGS